MREYIISVTREVLEKETLTVDEFVERVRGIEEIVAPESFGKRVQVKYDGSIEDLYDALGYTPCQVHIETLIPHRPID